MDSQTPPPRSLDISPYNLKDDEIEFFKSQTGIYDEFKLQEHILQVRKEAYAVYPYSCIRRFVFTTLKISRHPAYDDVLRIGKERPDGIFLDIGCCFGNDVRKAIADGYPRDNVVTSDLRPDFWTLGHKLFKSTPETFPVPFLQGNILDQSFLSSDATPVPASYIPPSPAPPLSKLTSLTPLQHHVSLIHISSVIHLFSEAQQFTLVYRLGTLLSPLPGSMIFGSQAGLPDIEENKRGNTTLTGRGTVAFVHSPTSYRELWIGEKGVFMPDEVVLRTEVTEIANKDVDRTDEPQTQKDYLLAWSVTRI